MTHDVAPTSRAPTEMLTHRQRLLDVYGALLTERQRDATRLHLDEDWSYAELAGHYRTTRSAAHDLVSRALERLERYEERLGHADTLGRRDAVESALRNRIASLEARLGVSA